jgi:DNA-binding NarL/FixJ family response regulator
VSGFRVCRIVEIRGSAINIDVAARESEKARQRSAPRDERRALRLTRREREILALLMEGCSNKDIASRLGVSRQTVKNQLSTMYQKAHVSSRLELVLFAQRHGLCEES